MKKLDISRRSRGFSLTELIVVIALIGILLAVAVPAYNAWVKKYAVEKETLEVSGELSRLRFRAIGTKMEHRAVFNQKQYIFKRYTSSADDGNAASSTIASTMVPYDIQVNDFGTIASNLTITFNPMGIVNTGSTIVIGPTDSNSSYNCFVVSKARINLGKMNGTTCEYK